MKLVDIKITEVNIEDAPLVRVEKTPKLSAVKLNIDPSIIKNEYQDYKRIELNLDNKKEVYYINDEQVYLAFALLNQIVQIKTSQLQKEYDELVKKLETIKGLMKD